MKVVFAHNNRPSNLHKKERSLKASLGADKLREAKEATPVTLPKVNVLTLDEIEKKYGKLK